MAAPCVQNTGKVRIQKDRPCPGVSAERAKVQVKNAKS